MGGMLRHHMQDRSRMISDNQNSRPHCLTQNRTEMKLLPHEESYALCQDDASSLLLLATRDGKKTASRGERRVRCFECGNLPRRVRFSREATRTGRVVDAGHPKPFWVIFCLLGAGGVIQLEVVLATEKTVATVFYYRFELCGVEGGR